MKMMNLLKKSVFVFVLLLPEKKTHLNCMSSKKCLLDGHIHSRSVSDNYDVHLCIKCLL